jgi:hypothetical protein
VGTPAGDLKFSGKNCNRFQDRGSAADLRRPRKIVRFGAGR